MKKNGTKKEKIAVKNNQKMLPVLDYSFEMPILILSLNLLFAGWKPVFDCVWEMPNLKYFCKK